MTYISLPSSSIFSSSHNIFRNLFLGISFVQLLVNVINTSDKGKFYISRSKVEICNVFIKLSVNIIWFDLWLMENILFLTTCNALTSKGKILYISSSGKTPENNYLFPVCEILILCTH